VGTVLKVILKSSLESMEQVVISSGLTDSFNPSLAIDTEDNVHVVWDKGEANRTQIYYAVYGNGVWSQQTPLTSGETAAENPSVTVASVGTVYVLYDKNDGQIYMIEYSNGWSREKKLTASGENTYPSVRWSFSNNPLNGLGGRIDYLWTSRERDQISVRYGNILIHRGHVEKAGSPLTLLGLAIAGVAVAAALSLILLHRKRST